MLIEVTVCSKYTGKNATHDCFEYLHIPYELIN